MIRAISSDFVAYSDLDKKIEQKSKFKNITPLLRTFSDLEAKELVPIRVLSKFSKNFRFSKSIYINFLSKFIRGLFDESQKSFELMKNELKQQSGISINLSGSIEKISNRIIHSPHIDFFSSDCYLTRNKNKMQDEKISDYLDVEQNTFNKNSVTCGRDSPLVSSFFELEDPHKSFKGINFSVDQSKLENTGHVYLLDKTEKQIFDGAVKIHTKELIEGGSQEILYNNVLYGGGSPNITLNFTMKIKDILDSQKRISELVSIMKDEGVEFLDESGNSITCRVIEESSLSELMVKVGKKIKEKNISMEEKESLANLLVTKMTVSLLGYRDVSDLYFLDIEKGVLSGNDYFNHGTNGALLNALFASNRENNKEKKYSSMSTDLFVKQGAADCRGTNCTTASLLNFVYYGMESTKEARIFYASVKKGKTAGEFNNCRPADHNIVVVSDQADKKIPLLIIDGYNKNFNNIPLSEAAKGSSNNRNYIQVVGATGYVNNFPSAL